MVLFRWVISSILLVYLLFTTCELLALHVLVNYDDILYSSSNFSFLNYSTIFYSFLLIIMVTKHLSFEKYLSKLLLIVICIYLFTEVNVHLYFYFRDFITVDYFDIFLEYSVSLTSLISLTNFVVMLSFLVYFYFSQVYFYSLLFFFCFFFYNFTAFYFFIFLFITFEGVNTLNGYFQVIMHCQSKST